MGIRVVCPNGHALHVKAFLAGRRGLCPHCGARFRIPYESSDRPQPLAEPPDRKGGRTRPLPPGKLAAEPAVPEIGELHSRSATNGPPSEPAAIWFVHPPTGGQFGPATSDVMRDWIREGRVNSSCLVWRDGWSEWQPASRILDSFKEQE